MAKIIRHDSNVPVPVEQAQLIQPFQFGDGGARVLQQIGGVLTEIGKRKTEMQDRLSVSKINGIMENAERDYEIEIQDKPLDEHAEILQKHRDNAMMASSQQKLSPQQKDFVDNKLGIWAQGFSDRGELANIKALERDTLIGVTADYEKALTEGNVEDIVETEVAFDEQAESSYTPEEAKVVKQKVHDRAEIEMERVANEDARRLAVERPSLAITIIDAEIKHRKDKGKPSRQFPLVSSEQLNSAKQLAKSTIVSNTNAVQEQFDVAIGEATSSVTKKIVAGTLTEDDVWAMPIAVAPSKDGDVGTWKKTWATVARGIAERKRVIQDGNSKKEREGAYEPRLVSELKTASRIASSTTAIESIRLQASQALTDNVINDDDYETIMVGAQKSFDTAVDRVVDESETQLSGIMLQGTSTASLTPWLQSQALAITLSGKKLTVEDTTALIQTFQDVGKAKQWAVDQTRRNVDVAVQKAIEDGKELTVDDVRKIYLQTQKVWLRKSDTQLTEEYLVWLKSKP